MLNLYNPIMQTHGPIRLDCRTEPMFQENAYVVIAPSGNGRAAWIIDPGFPPQPGKLIALLTAEQVEPAAILLTHGHPDHIAGVSSIRTRWPALPILAPAAEADFMSDPNRNLSARMGFPVTAPSPTDLLKPGDTLTLGDTTWEVRDVSGHSPGGLAFYCAAAGVVIVGDALFAGSIGRVDFPGGSGPRLLANIRANLLTLPDETVVYAGHGPPTTIGDERRENPYMQPGVVDALV